MSPGEIFTKEGEIELNAGRRTTLVKVSNSGDRPIQVGSHYHFFETNEALQFDRDMAYGFRLNIAAGTAQTFYFAFTANGALVPRDVNLSFACANANSARINPGLTLTAYSVAPCWDEEQPFYGLFIERGFVGLRQ